MARVTVEDCMPHVENLFQLVLVATKRARQLANGAESRVPWDNDKCTVVALREIAEGVTTHAVLDEPDGPDKVEEQPIPEPISVADDDEKF